jgi:uncharacterized membrane protein
VSIAWTTERLATLPVKGGVRQRGVGTTRLETFCDAAFAFAVTLLVIGRDGIPASYQELIVALKGIPAFAGSFSLIAGLWWSHRTWSRRYGLEDSQTTLISLAFVFVMLIYVYPLKMVFSAFASWASAGWLPTQFVMTDPRDMLGIFAVYGIGFAIQTGMLALLYLRVLKVEAQLGLDEVEQLRTRQAMVEHLVLGATGAASAAWALVLPPQVGIYAGFLYMTLNLTMPLLATKYNKRARMMQGELGP